MGQAFAAQPLCGKAAYAVVGCLDLLLGSRASDVDVQDAVKLYGFDRPALVARVLRLACALGLRQEAFVTALAEEPDYEHTVRLESTLLIPQSLTFSGWSPLSPAMCRDGNGRLLAGSCLIPRVSVETLDAGNAHTYILSCMCARMWDSPSGS